MINNDATEVDLSEIEPVTAIDEKIVAGLVESYQTTTVQIAPVILRPSEGPGKFVVVSGAHRVEAAVRSGWKAIRAVVIPYATEEDKQRAELIGLDENFVRRDLSPVERALNAQRRLELCKALGIVSRHGGDRRSAKAKSTLQGDNLVGAGALIGQAEGKSSVSGSRSIKRGKLPKEVLERIKPHDHLNTGKELDAMVDLEPAQREEVLVAAEAGKKTKATTRLAQVQRDLRELSLSGKQAALPAGRFGLILADPPWRWSPWGEEGMAKAVENVYPTMTLDDIKALPIADLAHDDSVLALWVRNDMIGEAVDVLRAWGFTLKSSIIWKKPRIGTGYYVRTVHEQLFICTRGHVPGVAPGRQVESVIEAPAGKHSEKPDIFYSILESYYPTLSKVELFQRDRGEGARPGWTVWGKESTPNNTLPGEPRGPTQPEATAGVPSPSETAAPPERVPPVARDLTDAERADLVRTGVAKPIAVPVPEGTPAEKREPPRVASIYSRGPDIAKPRLPT